MYVGDPHTAWLSFRICASPIRVYPVAADSGLFEGLTYVRLFILYQPREGPGD